jgi:hypothetical protein
MNRLHKVALFCSWLKHHAGLVGAIIFMPYMGFVHTADDHAYYEAADKLLTLGLQDAAGAAATLAVAAATTPAAAAVAAAAATHANLQLRIFRTRYVGSAAQLLALPAASLTHLDLVHNRECSGLGLDHSSISAALGQLSNFRSLELRGAVGNACLAAVGQLAQLTHLEAQPIVKLATCVAGRSATGSCGLRLLPQQLQKLHLCVGHAVGSHTGAVAVALGHLKALKALDLMVWCSVAMGSALPTSLTALTLSVGGYTDDSMQHLGLTALQQLQHLFSTSGMEQPQLLRQLSSPVALTNIQLFYEHPASAQQAAPAWQHLSALHTLDFMIFDHVAKLDAAQNAVLLQGLAAATSVVHLHMYGSFARDTVSGSQLCAHLTGLSRLRWLQLQHTGIASRADALHLAALTGLTRLDLWTAPGVDDAAASVLALRLTRLQELQLSECGLCSAAALPSIATLTGLTRLDLKPQAGGMTDGPSSVFPLGMGDLELLTPLTQLKEFSNDEFFCSNAFSQLWSVQQRQWRQQPPA